MKITNILFIILNFLSNILFSCEKEEEEEIKPQTIVKPSNKYLAFNSSSANHLSIAQNEKNSFIITTTGIDPYIRTNGLSNEMYIKQDWSYFSHHKNGQFAVAWEFPAEVLKRRMAINYAYGRLKK